MTYKTNIDELNERLKLPNALLSRKDIATIFGLCPTGSAISAMINSYDFPAPYVFSDRNKRWKATDVFAYMEQRRGA